MSTMSPSPRKRRTIGSSEARAAFVATLLVVATVAGCRRSGDVLVTYFSEHGFSLRHPAGWRIGQAQQAAYRYQYLMPPATGAEQPSLSVTFLAAQTAMPVDQYAQSYLANQNVGVRRAEERQGAKGESWVFASPDGKTLGRLLLVAADGRIVGLYAQGPAAAVTANAAALDEIWSSFTVERPERYPIHTWKGFDARIGIPVSWRQTQQFSGRGTMLVQFASPPLTAEKRQTVHAALSLTLEPAPAGGLAEYYDATRRKLGDNYVIASHEAIAGGFVDVMRTETPLAISYIKRYYLVRDGLACSLSFEAREDVFAHASRWADAIATTLRLGPAAAAAPETPR
jgi:hypothetical protein